MYFIYSFLLFLSSILSLISNHFIFLIFREVVATLRFMDDLDIELIAELWGCFRLLLTFFDLLLVSRVISGDFWGQDILCILIGCFLMIILTDILLHDWIQQVRSSKDLLVILLSLGNWCHSLWWVLSYAFWD